MGAREADELTRLGKDGAGLRAPGDPHALAPTELQQALVAQARSARSTVLVFTPKTAAISRAGGRRARTELLRPLSPF